MVGSGFVKTGAVLSWEGVQYCGTPGFKVSCLSRSRCALVRLARALSPRAKFARSTEECAIAVFECAPVFLVPCARDAVRPCVGRLWTLLDVCARRVHARVGAYVRAGLGGLTCRRWMQVIGYLLIRRLSR